MNAMYSVEQVNIPPELGTVMKQYTKAVLRDKPSDIYKYSANFFAALCVRPPPFDQNGELAADYDVSQLAERNVVSEQEAINIIFDKFDDGNGCVPLSDLSGLLDNIKETLGLQDGELPSVGEITELLQCTSDTVDLLELRQMLFEPEE